MTVLTFNFVILLLSAFVLTTAGVGFWRRIALKKNHLDIPNERSSHTEPTPRGGGLIIFIVTISFLLIWFWLNENLKEILPFLIGSLLIAGVSWLDDLYSLPNLLRFAVHTTAALIVVLLINHFQQIELPLISTFQLNPFIGGLITLIWIVGLTNAYNFMDGIDGIAGIQGFIAGFGWCVIGILTGQTFLAVFGGLILSSCAGFLWHNWHPAKIFMGDVGSAYLGYSLAVLSLFAARKPEIGNLAFVIGILLVWTFVFDTTLTFIKRALNGENVFSAHRSHLYQLLVIKGLRHDRVSLLYGAMSLMGAMLAIYILLNPGQIFIFVILPVLCVSLWLFTAIYGAKRTNG